MINSPVHVTYGRFNPPHIGHEKLFKAMQENAGETPMRIFLSNSAGTTKNPLTVLERYGFLVEIFPEYAGAFTIDDKIHGIIQVAHSLWATGYTKLVLYVGDDRRTEFQNLLMKYHRYGAPESPDYYSFVGGIEVISAGLRNDSSNNMIEAMSSSRLRRLALDKDFNAFQSCLPPLFDNKRMLFNSVRRALSNI